ncbi:MAG: SIS domain-containing protein [Sulfuricurvum sp.]|nr:SIS domain-containing protein [Sulfuricurvum sp.]MDD5387006.1 SIS domain-containing protein [Sulfuricurvum sp.]
MSLQSNRIYINNLIELLQKIDYEIVDQIIKILEEAAHKQSSIYIIGNGGSAATASHMVNDLGAGLRRRGLINLDITSLADNVPVITAIANDIGYENIFYMQLEGLLKPEDLIIAISCSGNSPNIVKAVEYAKNIGSTIIGITGFDGGDLKKLSDVNFHIEAPKGEYGLVEDMHMILDHMIYSYYINKGKTNV